MVLTNSSVAQLSAEARRGVSNQNWLLVLGCAKQILSLDQNSSEGWFLTGLVNKASGQTQDAITAFTQVIQLDPDRYDAAIEMAGLNLSRLEHSKAKNLLQTYETRLANSPLYLLMAADTYSKLGLHEKAWPLFKRADELQPGIDKLQASLAACAVLLGKITIAKSLYLALLQKHPLHQRNHYELSRLEPASDLSHIEQMKKVLQTTQLPANKNIFLYYAIAKELEDLQQWEEAFQYYALGGDAAAAVSRSAGYNVSSDIQLMECITGVCNKTWLIDKSKVKATDRIKQKIPIFVVGLPRTGTTLAERIIASHSRVESADESFFLQIAIQAASRLNSKEAMNPAILKAAAGSNMNTVADTYMNAIDYRLSDKPIFIDKYPFNFLYLGFIAKAFPGAHIVYMKRNPMDACFAMYKQSFFKFAYTLQDLCEYYIAYDRLYTHWKEVLGDRIIELEYESLVTDPEAQTRYLLHRLGLSFESSCLNFHLNKSASSTASTVQIREKPHTRSVNKWLKWGQQLQPLSQQLEKANILRTGEY